MPPPRPDVVALLLDTAPDTPLTHRDGRKFTPAEIRLVLSATPDDQAVAAEIRTHRGTDDTDPQTRG